MKELEVKIEQLREKLYQAYNEHQDEDTILDISTQLDQLLNQLNTNNLKMKK